LKEEIMENEQEVAAAASPPNDDDVAAVDTVGLQAAADPRLRRIAEYLAGSLAKQDSLQANLGAGNADLMMIAYKLAAVIKDSMHTTPASLDAYMEWERAISDLLRIHRQIDRYSVLDNRLTSAKAQALNAAAAAITQSEDSTK
jgi:hypothetical protein